MEELKNLGPIVVMIVLILGEAALMAALFFSLRLTAAVIRKSFSLIDFSTEKQ